MTERAGQIGMALKLVRPQCRVPRTFGEDKISKAAMGHRGGLPDYVVPASCG